MILQLCVAVVLSTRKIRGNVSRQRGWKCTKGHFDRYSFVKDQIHCSMKDENHYEYNNINIALLQTNIQNHTFVTNRFYPFLATVSSQPIR